MVARFRNVRACWADNLKSRHSAGAFSGSFTTISVTTTFVASPSRGPVAQACRSNEESTAIETCGRMERDALLVSVRLSIGRMQRRCQRELIESQVEPPPELEAGLRDGAGVHEAQLRVQLDAGLV